MTRLARAFQGEDSVPVTDFTDSIVWEECEFVQVADNGQSATSRVVILDTEADIPNVQTGKYLTSHNVFTVDDGPFRLFRGRVESFDWNRGHDEGKRLGPYTRFMDVTLSDYNRDLDGIVVHDFNRPEETDYARVQAVVATYLKGSPRTTTNLISSNYVSSSNSITVAAKVYRGTTPREILTELASTADKVVFVDVDGNLHYEGKDSTLFSSGLRISDDPADASAVTYGPIFTEGAPATHDGTELWSNLRYYYGGSSTGTGTVSNTNAPIYGYWESVQWNQRAGKAASALADAGGLLAEHKYNRVTLTVTIGPLPWGHLGSLKAGQIIQMKSKWLLGGKDAAGAYVYQGFLNYRIAELRWRAGGGGYLHGHLAPRPGAQDVLQVHRLPSPDRGPAAPATGTLRLPRSGLPVDLRRGRVRHDPHLPGRVRLMAPWRVYQLGRSWDWSGQLQRHPRSGQRGVVPLPG